MPTEPLQLCGNFTIGRGGEMTSEQLTELAGPVGAELERITADVERRLVPVEAARVAVNRLENEIFRLQHGRPVGTPRQLAAARRRLADATAVLERLATRFQADVDPRLAPLRPTIDRVLREAQADSAAASAGPDADMDRWLGPPGRVRSIIEAFRVDCVNGNHIASMSARTEEARVSVTTYQRVRQAYERLRPHIPAGQRLPSQPSWGGDD